MATDLIYKVPVRVIWLQIAIYKYRCPGRPNKRTNHSRQGADNIKERKYSHLQYQVKTGELKVIYWVRSWKNVLDDSDGLHVS